MNDSQEKFTTLFHQINHERNTLALVTTEVKCYHKTDGLCRLLITSRIEPDFIRCCAPFMTTVSSTTVYLAPKDYGSNYLTLPEVYPLIRDMIKLSQSKVKKIDAPQN